MRKGLNREDLKDRQESASLRSLRSSRFIFLVFSAIRVLSGLKYLDADLRKIMHRTILFRSKIPEYFNWSV
jgi:hypothetical protein